MCSFNYSLTVDATQVERELDRYDVILCTYIHSRIHIIIIIYSVGHVYAYVATACVYTMTLYNYIDSEVVYESSSSYTTSHRYSKKPFYIKNWDEKGTYIL